MERLPYIDAHGVEVAADVDTTWGALLRVVRSAFGGREAGGPGAAGGWVGTRARARFGGAALPTLGRVLGVEPSRSSGPWGPDLEPGTTLPGFTVQEVRRGELLSLRGRHRFARYRLDFELVAAGPDRSHVWARTWAEFPGLRGAAYRTLVIGSHAHVLAVRRMLRRTATLAA